MKNKKELITDPDHFRVAIFGSARIQMNDPLYNQVYRLARAIAKEGMDVVTGGGPGLMDAANSGHWEGRVSKKVHSFGLPIKLPKEQVTNKHLDIERDFERFSDRLDHFMTLANVVVVASGGVGTMLEFMYTWQLQQVHHICNTPIILMGKMWKPFLEWVKKWPLKKKYMSKSDLNSIFVVDHYRDAMKVIRKARHEFKQRGPDYCWNLEKYKLEN